jgi:protein gp37
MEYSNIEWTTHTFNPWIGCQHVSPGCEHCYAELMMDHRYHRVEWGPHGERKRTGDQYWKQPIRWAKEARQKGHRPRVFCASLADVWDNQVPSRWLSDLFRLINSAPELDWLLLTKRPENIRKRMLSAFPTGGLFEWPLENLWLGTTCEDQEHYDHRWPILRRIPAAIHFISYEPALGPLTLGSSPDLPDWIICGGESGKDARLMDPGWAADLLDECRSSNVASFMKQMTQKKTIPNHLLVRQFPIAQIGD